MRTHRILVVAAGMMRIAPVAGYLLGGVVVGVVVGAMAKGDTALGAKVTDSNMRKARKRRERK